MLTIDRASELSHYAGHMWIVIEAAMLPVAIAMVWRMRSHVAPRSWAQALLEAMLLAATGRLLFTILIAAWEIAGVPYGWLDVIIGARGARAIPVLVFPLAMVLPFGVWRVVLALSGGLMAVGMATVVWMLVAL